MELLRTFAQTGQLFSCTLTSDSDGVARHIPRAICRLHHLHEDVIIVDQDVAQDPEDNTIPLPGWKHTWWLPRWAMDEVDDIKIINQIQPMSNTTLQNVTVAAKRLLSPALCAQIKAGYRNADLSLTDRGCEQLLEIVANQTAVEKEFTAAAKAEVKERAE